MEISVETGKSQQKHGASITFQMLVSLVIIQQRRLLGINYFAPPRSLKSGATLLNGRGILSAKIDINGITLFGVIIEGSLKDHV